MIRHAVVLMTLAALATPAAADDAEPDPDELLSKKEQYVRAKEAREQDSAEARKRWQARLQRRIGKPPEKVINVFNGWTHENLVVDADSRRLKLEDDEVDRFLRCRFTNKTTDMDDELLPAAIRAAQHFGSDRIVVVSAYRSPKYNLMLRKKGREVSRTSKHKLGKALDFRLDGVSAARLRDWAKHLRLGGVGYYSQSGFVHVDTARVRYWTGR